MLLLFERMQCPEINTARKKMNNTTSLRDLQTISMFGVRALVAGFIKLSEKTIKYPCLHNMLFRNLAKLKAIFQLYFFDTPCIIQYNYMTMC